MDKWIINVLHSFSTHDTPRMWKENIRTHSLNISKVLTILWEIIQTRISTLQVPSGLRYWPIISDGLLLLFFSDRIYWMNFQEEFPEDLTCHTLLSSHKGYKETFQYKITYREADQFQCNLIPLELKFLTQ